MLKSEIRISSRRKTNRRVTTHSTPENPPNIPTVLGFPDKWLPCS